MAILKPFKGLRPPAEISKNLASRPYDVLDSEEARREAGDNPVSFLRVVKPEIELPEGTDSHSPEVYQKAFRSFQRFMKEGWLVADRKRHFYIYALEWGGRTQVGVVGCAGVSDYLDGTIKKHELTRKDKEEDRMNHIRVTNANAEPVFFTYRKVDEIDRVVEDSMRAAQPVCDFVADDGVAHKFWVVDEDAAIARLEHLFMEVPCFYVADGHHRTAAAALVGEERRRSDPESRGTEEYNLFMSVLFPHDQLRIIDYNRVVKDLNGLDRNAFLEKLRKNFVVEEAGEKPVKPEAPRSFGMYLEGTWHSLAAKPGVWDESDPVGALDVTILSRHVLDDILGIRDLRTDQRIDFVGGIRGMEELERRVDSGEMAVAFALYPVSMDQLMAIADSGQIMPPKTTWFEPKLRSGLVVHLLE